MATPVVVSPRKQKSFFGPLVLIALGTVFLLGNMGVLTWKGILFWFARYWPALFIVWGAVKLIEYMWAKREGLPAPGIGVGGVFFAIILLLAGAAASGVTRVNWRNMPGEIRINDEVITLFGERYEYSVEQQTALAPNTSLKMAIDDGSIRVVPSEDGNVRITGQKIVIAEDRQKADTQAQQIEPKFRTEGNVLVIATERGMQAGERLILELQVPRKATLDLSTLRGSIDVMDREADVRANNSNGDITLSQIKGNVRAQERSGDFRAENITGNVELEGRVDDLTIATVSGAVTVNATIYGDVTLSSIQKSVRLKTSRSEVEFARLDGEFHMDSGGLRASQITGPTRMETKSKDISIEDFAGDISVITSNGEVELRPKTLGNIQVKNERGQIDVILPQKAAFTIDARATRGQVESDFQTSLQTQGNDQRATGQVGNGGPRVDLQTDRGNIQIRKG